MTPHPQPPPNPRSSGCWLIGCSSILIATVLTVIALFLPPISLPDRLLALSYSPLNADSPTLTFDSALRLSVPEDDTTTDFALKLTRLTQAEFDGDHPDHPEWLPNARGSLPPDLSLQSSVYVLESRGSPPNILSIEFDPPGEFANPERLALHGWDGVDWRFIPSQRSATLLSGSARFLPSAVALFERLPSMPIVLVSQEVTHDLDADITSLATILSPAGLRPTGQGGLIGSLAPGGDSDSAYLFMPLIRNFHDPRALDTATVEGIISSPALRVDHIEKINHLTSFNNFDGVFIDYRGLSANYRDNFTQFIIGLATSLSQRGLLLGIVVPTVRNDSNEWQRDAYDWQEIGAAADFFQLRTTLHPLDFAPGAAGSIEQLLLAATNKVDSRKVLLGLSARSLREVNGVMTRIGWHEAFAALGDVILQADQVSETGSIEPGAVVRASLSGYRARFGFDSHSQTTFLDYIDDTGTPVSRIWLIDDSVLRHRLERTMPFAIAGLAFDDLLASNRVADMTQTILNYKVRQSASSSAAQLGARWSIDGSGGPLDQVDANLDEDLVLTLEAPDGNYAVNWSVIGSDGSNSDRQGAVLPLFQPTPTPTPTPIPTPTPRPVAAPSRAISSPGRSFGNAPPPPGSIRIEIGGHVSDTGSSRAIVAMRTAGMTWMKKQERFSWHGPPDIGHSITTAHNNGFKILVGTVGSPDELAQGGQAYIDSFTDWLQRIAGQGADAIEVWNEPNLDREWPRGQISGLAYAKMLASAYQKIKQVNPSTIVISAAPAPTGVSDRPDRVMPDNRWLRQMVEGGGLNYLDCVGAHYNEGIVPPGQTSGDPRGDNYYTRYFYGMLNGYISITRRPICFTELGYVTSEGLPNLPEYFSWAQNVTLQQQATWLAQAAALASQSGQVRLLIVWNVDFTQYNADPQAGYAIVRPDGSCPACNALAAAR